MVGFTKAQPSGKNWKKTEKTAVIKRLIQHSTFTLKRHGEQETATCVSVTKMLHSTRSRELPQKIHEVSTRKWENVFRTNSISAPLAKVTDQIWKSL